MACLKKTKYKGETKYYILDSFIKDGKRVRQHVQNLGDIPRFEAKALLAQYEIKNKGRDKEGGIFLKQAFEEFQKHFKTQIGRTIKPGTFQVHLDYSKRNVELLGHIELRNLSFADIEQFKNILQTTRNISNRSVNLHLSELSRVLKWSINQGWINTLPHIQRLSEIKPNNDIEFLTREDLDFAIFHATPTQRLYLELLFYSGIRPHEAAILLWENVRFADNDGSYIHVISDNPRKSGRKIPLHPTLEKILLPLQGEPSQNVSPYKTTSVARRSLSRLSHKLSVVAKREIIVSPYKIRKTFGTLAAQSGIDPLTLAKFMGHSRIQTTYKHYLGIEDKTMVAAIKKL